MSTLSVDTIQGKTTAGTLAMPSGFVIGHGHAESTTENTITSSSFSATSISLSYTAKKANSKLLLSWAIPVRHDDSNANSELVGVLQLYKDGSSLDTSYRSNNIHEFVLKTGSVAGAQFLLDAGDTSSHTWALYAKTTFDNFKVFHGGTRGSLTILEIAQ
tara:strand:+ start:466 stop:945 length:480 start_codon:yes stop_codon:yes gene_type:complete